MELEKLADWVKENNQKEKNRGNLASILYICLQFVVCTMFGTDRMLLLIAVQCIVFVAALDVWRYQCDSYLKVSDMEGFPYNSKNISEVLRFHAFSIDDYFVVIRKKLVVKGFVLSVLSLGIGILTGLLAEKGFDAGRCFLVTVFGIISAFSFFLILYLKKKIFVFQCLAGERGKVQISLLIVSAIFSVIEVLAVVGIWPVFSLILYAIMSGILAPDIDETMVVYRCYPYGTSYYMVVLLCGFLGIWAVLNRQQFNKSAKVFIAASVFGLIASMVGLAVDCHNYIEIKENQLIVSSLQSQVTYSLDDVTKFQICEEDERVQMVVYIGKNRDNTLKLSGAVTETSQRYEQKYYSEYNYFADLAEILMEKGAKGEVRDIPELQESVKGYDPELKEGLDKIIETVPAE